MYQLATDYIFDVDGFFIDPASWNLELAQHIAVADGLGQLDDSQLELLQTLRHEFDKHGAVTALNRVCHIHGHETGCMHHIFRSPRQAWRIAGLPNPGEEAKSYLS